MIPQTRKRNFEYFVASLFFIWAITAWGWQNMLPHFRLVNLIIVVGLFVFLVFRKGWQYLHLTKIAMLLLIFALWQALSLFWTPLPSYASDDVTQFFLFVLIYLLLQGYFKSEEQIGVWEHVFLFFTTLIVLIALPKYINWYWGWWKEFSVFPPIHNRLQSGIIGHPNVLAGLISIALPLLIVRWQVSSNWMTRVWTTFILGVLVMAVYFTSSRGGWVSCMAGLSATLLVLNVHKIREILRAKNWENFFSFKKVLSGILMIIGLLIIFQVLYLNYRMTPEHGGRLGLWKLAWEIWKENIWIGRGAGSFELLFSDIVQLPPGFWAVHAHNGFLQMGAEFGIFGVTIIIAALAKTGIHWGKAYLAAGGAAKTYRLAAYAGVIVAVFTHQFIDFVFYSPAYSLVVVLFVMWLENLSREKVHYGNSRLSAVLVTILLLLIMGGTWNSIVGLGSYWQGIVSSWRSDWQAAREEFCDLAVRYPGKSFYGFQCGLAGLFEFDQSGDAEVLHQALQTQNLAIGIDPHWPNHWANKALLEWYSGDAQAAMESMQRATELAPRYSLFWLNLGWMQESLGDEYAATRYYQAALEKSLWLQVSPFFSETALRSQVLAQFRVDYDRRNCQVCEAYFRYKSGELDTAEELLRNRLQSNFEDADGRALLALVLQKLGDERQAWYQIQYALLQRQTPRILGWAAEIARAQSKDDYAFNYLKIARELLPLGLSLDGYYTGIYHLMAMTDDHPPQLLNPLVTPELVSGLEWLNSR